MCAVVYAVFPIGEYKYVWSPKISDLFLHAEDMKQIIKPKEERGTLSHGTVEISQAAIESLYKHGEYTDKDLHRAITFGHEIMVNCAKAYAVVYDHYHDGQQVASFDIHDVKEFL